MARWASLVASIAILAPAALAGCVKPEETQTEPPTCPDWAQRWCHDEGACGDCCGGCATPPSHPPEPTPCALCDCATNVPCSCDIGCCEDICWVGPPPPLLDVIEAQLLARACDGCHDTALATTPGGRILVATERGVHVREPDGTTRALLADDAPARVGGTRSSPSLSTDADGRIWWAALSTNGATRTLAIVAWDETDAILAREVSAIELPPLALAQRAHIVATHRELVIVLATDDAAWATRTFDHGASFGPPELLTPPEGRARVGTPVRDGADRVLVPYAREPARVGHVPTGVIPPGSSGTTLHMAVLETSGFWTQRGGFTVAQPLAPGTWPALATSENGAAAFAWTDASAIARRVETWDDAGSWAQPIAWSTPSAPVVGSVASAQQDARATLAWWSMEGTLVVARSDAGAAPATRQDIVAPGQTSTSATLALTHEGRAVLAWVDEGALWVGIER